MFFILSKIIAFVFTPIIWVFSLLISLFFIKDLKRKKKVLIYAVSVFYIFTNSFILEEVNRIWEIPATKYEALKVYDAGIVLGGILEYDEQLERIQFYRSADRLFQAVALYKKGYIKKIFFVGGSGSIEFAHLKEGVFVKQYLLTLGIPEDDIWIENESRNTYENAVNAKEILRSGNLLDGNFLLITSGQHMRRSLVCFKKLGINVSSYSVDRMASPVRRFTFDHLFIPDAKTIMMWNPLIHEWVGVVAYKLKGYS